MGKQAPQLPNCQRNTGLRAQPSIPPYSVTGLLLKPVFYNSEEKNPGPSVLFFEYQEHISILLQSNVFPFHFQKNPASCWPRKVTYLVNRGRRFTWWKEHILDTSQEDAHNTNDHRNRKQCSANSNYKPGFGSVSWKEINGV